MNKEKVDELMSQIMNSPIAPQLPRTAYQPSMLVSNPVFQNRFLEVFHADNVYAITLKLSPIWWEHKTLFEKDFVKYCSKRAIEYYLVSEVGVKGNLHFHGLLCFPFETIRKRFQTWFNKSFGHVYTSHKSDAQAWYTYCHKHEILYLFDDVLYNPYFITQGLKE